MLYSAAVINWLVFRRRRVASSCEVSAVSGGGPGSCLPPSSMTTLSLSPAAGGCVVTGGVFLASFFGARGLFFFVTLGLGLVGFRPRGGVGTVTSGIVDGTLAESVIVGACACGGGTGGFFFLHPLSTSDDASSHPTTMVRFLSIPLFYSFCPRQAITR